MKARAFTVIELLVALSIASILVTVSISVYGLFRKSINKDQSSADSVQNARVASDRMARELRQTPDIRTIFPADPSDMSVAQPGQIEFEDGDQTGSTALTYRHYFLSSGTLMLEVKECFFLGQNVRVHWNDVSGTGGPPTCAVIAGSTQSIAQNVTNLAFYGHVPLQMVVTTQDLSGQLFVLRTSISSRNL